jgi:hypothetical protein
VKCAITFTIPCNITIILTNWLSTMQFKNVFVCNLLLENLGNISEALVYICWHSIVITFLTQNIYCDFLSYKTFDFMSRDVLSVYSFRQGPSVSFSHLNLLLWNHWTELNQTCQKCSLDGPLPDLCFWCWFEIQHGQKLTWPRWPGELKNRPIRNKNCLWWPCLLMDWDKMSNLYRGWSLGDPVLNLWIVCDRKFKMATMTRLSFDIGPYGKNI